MSTEYWYSEVTEKTVKEINEKIQKYVIFVAVSWLGSRSRVGKRLLVIY